MKSLVMGALRGDVAAAQAIQATVGSEFVSTLVMGDHFGSERQPALDMAAWLATRLAGENFTVLVGNEDIPILWPYHPWNIGTPVPDWGAEVRAALGSQIAKFHFLAADNGTWFSHAGITTQVIQEMGGLTPSNLNRMDNQCLAAMTANENHILLDRQAGCLESNWRRSVFVASTLQGVAHPFSNEPQRFLHPQYRSGVVHVGGHGYAIVRDLGQNVVLHTLP